MAWEQGWGHSLPVLEPGMESKTDGDFGPPPLAEANRAIEVAFNMGLM